VFTNILIRLWTKFRAKKKSFWMAYQKDFTM